MTDAQIFEKLKIYCEYELQMAINYRPSANLAFTRAYGAMMYTSNYLCENWTDVAVWWENDMWNRFMKVLKGEM